MSRPPRRPPPPRHTVAVEIAGEKHVLRSDVPPEYTRAVAAHVDATIRALPGFQTLEPFRAATLAALSITDELFRAREEIRRLRDETERRTAELADILEAAEAAGAEKRPVRRPAPTPGSSPTWISDASGDAKPGDAKPGDAKPGDTSVDAKPGNVSGDEKSGDASGDAMPGEVSVDDQPDDPPPSRRESGAASPSADASSTPPPPPAEPDPLPAWIEDAVQRTPPAPRLDLDEDGEPELMLPPPEHHPAGGKEPAAEE
jgi:cell division protein ZapA (FtsZ GTPase activity inhibitor)